MFLRHMAGLRTRLIFAFMIALMAFPTPMMAQSGFECPGAPATQLSPRILARINGLETQTLRDTATAQGAKLIELYPLDFVEITGDPICADGVRWWPAQPEDRPEISGFLPENQSDAYVLVPLSTPSVNFDIPGEPKIIDVQFNGMSLVYQGQFGNRARVRTRLAVTENLAPDSPAQYMFPYPKHIEIIFKDESRDAYRQPILRIYLLADYRNTNSGVKEMIDSVERILKTRPTAFAGEAPLAPLQLGAGQVLATSPTYLSFNGISGFRYFAAYAQDTIPILVDTPLYVFQGISDDGKYFISFRAYVRLNTLAQTMEGDSDFQKFTQAANAEAYDAYRKVILDKFASAKPGDYAPALDTVDALIASLQVN